MANLRPRALREEAFHRCCEHGESISGLLCLCTADALFVQFHFQMWRYMVPNLNSTEEERDQERDQATEFLNHHSPSQVYLVIAMHSNPETGALSYDTDREAHFPEVRSLCVSSPCVLTWYG